ncbi:MAG: Spy0128 family protein [Collinsella sp.]
MKANSEKTKQSKKATRRVLAGVLCGASVLSLVLSLVMPPISQAIANDAQTVPTEETVMGGGSSSESTDVDNSTNGDAGTDAENQNSDDAASDDDALPEEQSKDESQAEDNDAMDVNAVASAEEAAESEETTTAITNIANADDLSAKLQGVGENQTACFELTADIDYAGEIKLEKSGSNITLNLNGHKIKCLNTDKPLFDVANGATLTIKDEIKDSAPVTETVNDVQQLTDQGQKLDPDNYGKKAALNYVDGIPSNLTYYVTKSTPSGTGTIETLVSHSVDIKGAIVACGGNANLKLINLYNNNGKGGTFNLVSGVITQKQGGSVSSLVYAENGSTVNMSGGYVCGASGSPAGAGIMVSNEKGSASTLNLTGGVIAGNSAYSGGGVYARYSKVTITNGIISGNSTLNVGLGGGIMAEGGIVTVSGGYITNNRMAQFCGMDGNGCHGGAGLAANNGVHVTISGGQITGNYSEEAGGGVYVTSMFHSDMAWLNITGGNIASNVSYRSEGAGIRVGQKVDAMISGASKDSPVYITNNHCMSRYDWGGGGIFVQGSNETASNAGRLFVYSSYISTNTAGGYGGGVAVCPTGKTLVTNTDGTAIFGNTDAGAAESYDSKNKNNDGNPHLSGGGNGKTEDKDAYNSVNSNGEHVFRTSGHADFFLAAKGHTTPVAVVSGKMLGDIDAKYSGSIELTNRITIPANGAAQVKNSIGLTSGVDTTDKTMIDAVRNKATTFITGNYSWDHGGGIMSNGNLYLGQPADTYVYPSLKLKATKKLIDSQADENKTLTGNEFTFAVYRKDSKNPFVNGKFNRDACTEVGTAKNDASGNITFDLDEQFATSGTADTTTITYYLVEDSGAEPGITYDSAVYEIEVSAKDNPTELMTVPKKDEPNVQIALKIHNYTIEKVKVTKHELDKSSGMWSVTKSWDNLQKSDDYYPITCKDSSTTFTNEYTPYTSSGSWTPKATKVVEGGEMKEFTLQLATDKEFTKNVQNKSTKTDAGKSQTLSFDEIKYELKDLEKLASDSTGRGASKTFTYYVREQQPTTPFTNYKYDESVYRFDVTMTDQKDGTIKATTVTYTKIQDAGGNPIDDQKPIVFNSNNPNEHGPTFTNTYSTSLPLSGMSGVTLTYLAGAAVLCAAAAWMHIRRKANAKGGERRE